MPAGRPFKDITFGQGSCFMNVKDGWNTNGLGGQSDSLCQMLLQAHEESTEAESRALKAPLVLPTAGGIGDSVPMQARITAVGRAGR